MSGGDVVLSLSRHAAGAIRSTALLLFASVVGYSSVVTVLPTVTDTAGLYHYAYSISYTGTDDAFLVDISVAANPTAVTDIKTPTGFNSQFDSVLGLVSFLENGSYFSAVPTAGFSFDSSIAPSKSLFNASVFDSNFNIHNVAGSTVAPTPEPSFLYLFVFMAPLLLLFSRRNLAKRSQMETLNVTNT